MTSETKTRDGGRDAASGDGGASGRCDNPIGFRDHDHADCVKATLAEAEARCAASGVRLTPVRRKVLEVLAAEHRALGAYAILDVLRAEGFASQPPVAYRALDFLAKHGLVHRIEHLNAYVACAQPSERHSPAFMICRVCSAVAEADAAVGRGALADAARAAGFQIERTVLEAEGVCTACAEKSDT